MSPRAKRSAANPAAPPAPIAPARIDGDLARLLRDLRPRLHDEHHVFISQPPGAPIPPRALGWFREAEADSVIIPVAEARARGMKVEDELAAITLEVNSTVADVGLTAAVSTALAAEGIACNVVAALRHDHLFVPAARAADAMRILTELSQRAG